MFQKYIGDRAFYRRVLTLAIPIIIQNGITNFVSLLDNLMVGQLGTLPMGGVAIVNQLMMVFNLIIYGVNGGTGIFTSQFCGSKNHEGIRHTFRFKALMGTFMTLLCISLFLIWGDSFIGFFLQGEGSPEDAAQILRYGKDYLLIILFGLIPFALSSTYSSTLRECGQCTVPMISGVTAVFTNLVLNYTLIFGHFGAPAMGVKGAALATAISRYVELGIVSIWAHTHAKEHPFIRGVYRTFHIPASLLKPFFIRVIPLVLNETLWSMAITTQQQCYTTCGLDVVNALNIVSTISNLTNVVVLATCNVNGILVGQMLGAQVSREAVRDENRKLMTLSVFFSVLFSLLLVAIAKGFPMLYNTSADIRSLATRLILILAIGRPFNAYSIAVFYALRAGGRSWITFLFDCGFLWVVSVPLAFILSRFTGLSIIPIYLLCQIPDMLKATLGSFLVRTDLWIRNITVQE